MKTPVSMKRHRTLEDMLEFARSHEGFFGEHRYPLGVPFGVNSPGSCGDTPLHFYVWSDDLEAARVLLDAGADPNAPGDLATWRTPRSMWRFAGATSKWPGS